VVFVILLIAFLAILIKRHAVLTHFVLVVTAAIRIAAVEADTVVFRNILGTALVVAVDVQIIASERVATKAHDLFSVSTHEM
jgi:hypothetical protein